MFCKSILNDGMNAHRTELLNYISLASRRTLDIHLGVISSVPHLPASPALAEVAAETAAKSLGKLVPGIAVVQGVYAADKAKSYFASCYAEQ